MANIRPTVEKIGGTSMVDYAAVRDNIFKKKDDESPYARVFVVSAYAGMTNHLLRDKKTGQPGVFALFKQDPTSSAWRVCLDSVKEAMLDLNGKLFADHAPLLREANHFIGTRVDEVKDQLATVGKLLETGFFEAESSLPQCEEMLACLGEAHSAWNLAHLIEADLGYNTQFVDLSAWQDQDFETQEQLLKDSFSKLDLGNVLPVVTGYSRSEDGMMKRYGRGYTEMTMSYLAVMLHASEAIIHKEFHLSSADPRLVGVGIARTLDTTDYDIADQLSHYGMEAIHPEAARGMRQSAIPIRVKNTFDPEHPGTLIGTDEEQYDRVEIIASRDDVVNINTFDHDMLGNLPEANQYIHDLVDELGGDYISSTHSANSVGVVATMPREQQKRLVEELDKHWPDGSCESESVAQIGVLGRGMEMGRVLRDGINALLSGDVKVLGASTGHRDIEVRFVVPASQHDRAVVQLHSALVVGDKSSSEESAA
ncbi:aspartate kinase [gamma proteobacterium HTCC5015]|nr:aspartate kinase [gamma proteobacterium HTCC5015]